MAGGFSVDIFWAAKDGHSDDEYEDAACAGSSLEGNDAVSITSDRDNDGAASIASDRENGGAIYSYAVADGASETSFAGIWARSLVTAYCQGQISDRDNAPVLKDLRQRWSREVESLKLPWFAQDKAEEGAFSTLCGLTFIQDDTAFGLDTLGGHWQALAVGDSCLFHLRASKILQSFPLDQANLFGSNPDMFCSVERSIDPEISTLEGDWIKGDIFLLMTDALACWFLMQVEMSNQNLPTDVDAYLDKIQSQSDFNRLVNQWRQADADRALRNDDVTLVVIKT